MQGLTFFKPNVRILLTHTQFCMCYAHSVAQLCQTLWPHGLQPTRLLRPWGFSRQEHWSGLPFPSPVDLPDPGIELGSPALQANSLPSEPPGKSLIHFCCVSRTVCGVFLWQLGQTETVGIIITRIKQVSTCKHLERCLVPGKCSENANWDYCSCYYYYHRHPNWKCRSCLTNLGLQSCTVS